MSHRHQSKRRNNTGLKVFTSFMSILSAVVLIAGVVFTDGFMSLAQDELTDSEKYYKSITIEQGDTLWDIAEEYMTDDYDSIDEYVSALKHMNNMSGDKILAGDTLLVVYHAPFDV